MSFVVPNVQGVGSVTLHERQSRWYETDISIWAAGLQRGGVSSGCAVTAQGTPNNTVAVATGTVVIADTSVAVGAGNVTMTAAHGTNPRFDLITVNNAGTKAYTAGTAAADPVPPAIPANSVVLATIYVPANDNVINATQIVDKRVLVPSPVSGALWTTVSKAADQTKTTDTTLANDSTLVFTMAGSTKYRIRGVIWFDCAATPDFKYAFTGPASSTIAFFSRRDGSGANAPAQRAIDVTYPGSSALANAAVGTNTVSFDAIVHNVNSGTFAFQWAQNTSDAGATIVRAGSYLEYAVA